MSSTAGKEEDAPRAVQFGAGRVGRGFLGQLLFQGGYQTTFVDADAGLVAALEARRAYPLRLVSDQTTQELSIGRLRALDIRSAPERLTQALVNADLASTAVGAAVLPHLAVPLAAGLAARARAGRPPLNILLCENQWHAAALMRDLLRPHLPADALPYVETNIGLVETVIGRMVPAPTPEMRAEDPLLVVAEPYAELPVAADMLRGDPPPLPGLIPAADFDAYEARKLFLHNAAHAALAYAGHAAGHLWIWQCAADPAVAGLCRDVLAESSQALVAEYGFDPPALESYTADLLRRFANKTLGDGVARVAADPLRKLRPSDRLVGAALLCFKHGISPRALARVIALALAYNDPADPSAHELQRRLREERLPAVLQSVCGVAPESPFAHLIGEGFPGR